MPLSIFIKKVRTNIKLLFVIAILVNLGMWLERFVIIISSLANDFNPYNWGKYSPTFVEWGIFLGTIGGFFFLFFSFTRLAPVVAISEVKAQLHHDIEGGSHE